MNTITVNGITVKGSGNIVISNGKVTVNGKDVTPDSKEIFIIVNGNTEMISADACNTLTVTGSIGSLRTMSGDVNVAGNIEGHVDTMSGDVECEIIYGSVKTLSGDIKTKKQK